MSTFDPCYHANRCDGDFEVGTTSYLDNSLITSLTWSHVIVTAPSKHILADVSGSVDAGEMMAVIGPSGSGKTTSLNALAHRQVPSQIVVSAESRIFVNNQKPSVDDMETLSSYAECEEALIGSLTVRETLTFAAWLSLSAPVSTAECVERVDAVLQAFGLRAQAQSLIGTFGRKGISTGQRRRVSVASQLMSAPKILFLDEPTSGLDSEASYNVMSFIEKVAKLNGLLVVASIHQPSSETFRLFDKVLLLSSGRTCYSGYTADIKCYFEGIGFPIPTLTNPADFMLRATNVDFDGDQATSLAKMERIYEAWKAACQPIPSDLSGRSALFLGSDFERVRNSRRLRIVATTWIVTKRSWIKARRDVLVYGLRFGMYLGLAVLMGTVWLRLPPTQASLQPLANCILFGSSFMSFMAVVYVPAFIEDYTLFIRERSNGLYGATTFLVSNFIVGLPYLFGIALSASAFVYWMVNFRPAGEAFMTWVMWLYLNLLAAESLVVLMSVIFPNFVAALALTAMCNGVWMACNGFMVPRPSLNVFYRYVFYYVNYQAYVFRGLIENEFTHRTYGCGEGCYCMYDTKLQNECKVAGTGVLRVYGFDMNNGGLGIGITLAIIGGMRLLAWAIIHRLK